MPIDEGDLREALDRIDKDRQMLEGDLFHGEQWIPAAHRNEGRLSIDLQTMTPDLTERELQMWRLGRIEGRGEVMMEIGDAFRDGYELE
ncbi:hypothetical protein C465_01344 [Halorubrum distributum JCM 9100]|uniref:Uncharacterized protein n=2 Tax=Halorubrum distributum TaxID=29283 RepID=M0EZK7_9EURY|nr:hypothetical protein [Halorubrum distributum]ELZ49858.1 hypothetical protein C466_15799 [Halorubrum distributum JCM 10118]ELZ53150.1 hypothetical protein C465_01344 [Halorubrum distributum JCM 9100]